MTTWTARATPFDGAPAAAFPNARRCAWSPTLGKFCAIGINPAETVGIILSTDGITWTSGGPDPIRADGSNDICWSTPKGIFVIVGDDGNDTPINAIYTSTNGSSWTARGNPFGAALGSAVAWSDDAGLFVAVATANDLGAKCAATSPDGVTWTGHNTPFDLGELDSVAYSPELVRWVAIGNTFSGGTKQSMTSSDGVTWTAHAAPSGFMFASRIRWIDRLSLFVVMNFNGVTTSPDGLTWTVQSSPFSPAGSTLGWGVDDCNGVLVACGASSDQSVTVIESTDAITWTASPSPYDVVGLPCDVCFSSGLALCAVTGEPS